VLADGSANGPTEGAADGPLDATASGLGPAGVGVKAERAMDGGAGDPQPAARSAITTASPPRRSDARLGRCRSAGIKTASELGWVDRQEGA